MDRVQALVFIMLSCSFLAFIFVIIAIATNEWIVIKILDMTMSLGLWKFCVFNICMNGTATIPAVLAIITVILIVISLIVAIVINLQKQLSPEIYLIPSIFFFVSIIMLFATIGIFWPEVSLSPLQTVVKSMTSQPTLNAVVPKARTIDEANSQIPSLATLNSLIGSGLNGFDFDKLDLDITKLIIYKHGFSSALLLTALPLLMICLIASTFIAGFRKGESITNNNHVDMNYANKH